MEPVRVRVLDLTVDQIEGIEKATGVPLDGWQSAPSKMAIYRRIYSAATGATDAEVGSMTMRQLTDSVVLDDDEDTADPT